MTEIDYASPALGPVRARIAARIDEHTKAIVNTRTPLDQVPHHRGEIAALVWLLAELDRPKEVIT
jgi:hypothetical protein